MGVFMEIAIEQQENKEFRPYLELKENYKPTKEEKIFFMREYSRLKAEYKGKVFNKEKNTIFGQPIEEVSIPANKIAGFSKDNFTPVKALKIGYVYIIETKGMPNGWNWTGYTLEELYSKITTSEELLKQINPVTVLYGYLPEIKTSRTCNPYSIYQEEEIIWRD